MVPAPGALAGDVVVAVDVIQGAVAVVVLPVIGTGASRDEGLLEPAEDGDPRPIFDVARKSLARVSLALQAGEEAGRRSAARAAEVELGRAQAVERTASLERDLT